MAASKGSVQEIDSVQVDGLVSQRSVVSDHESSHSVTRVALFRPGGTEGDQALSGGG